jgi:hypothetical protein
VFLISLYKQILSQCHENDTISIAKGRPVRRIREGSCSDRRAGGVLKLLLMTTMPRKRLTISIAKGRPVGRTREGSCSDRRAGGVLKLLLMTAADHATGIAPAYAPHCRDWYRRTSCQQISHNKHQPQRFKWFTDFIIQNFLLVKIYVQKYEI